MKYTYLLLCCLEEWINEKIGSKFQLNSCQMLQQLLKYPFFVLHIFIICFKVKTLVKRGFVLLLPCFVK